MKKLYLIFTLFILATLYNNLISQTIFLQQGFENGGSVPVGWTQIKKTGNALWDFIDGGALPPGTEEGLPPSAHSGSYNARFYKSSFSVHETYLVSPEFSFEFAQKPELKFYYAQIEDQLPGSDPDNNTFKIYWRSPEEGNVWFFLKELNQPTIGWVFDSLPIPDSITNKKYKKVQLGFLGISATVGYGSCIDDILLIETDTVTKYIEKVYATQPNLDIIPSGSLNNPILRLRFPVQGNDGILFLDSLVVTALEKSTDVVAPNGVKLFHTVSDVFSNTHQIGAASFVNGKAIFNNIHYELPFGNSYVWVTYDVPVDTEHAFKNIKVDAKIEANSIKVNEAYFPISELNPNGTRTINESVFFDDFETIKPWALTGEFERDTAFGLGGFYQNADPTYAVSGVKVLGTDLTGLGTKIGDYELGLTIDEYSATTSSFDGSYYKNLNLQYYRWLNVNFGDTAGIDYSIDNGVTWNRIWNSSALIAENEWRFQQLSLTNLLDRKPNVKLRFILGPTGVSQSLSGWNVDNFALTGTYVNDDVGISALITPTQGCGHVAPEELEITVKNYGFDATPTKIPVGFSLNDGVSWTYDTIQGSIPQNGSVNFTFTQLIDFTVPGSHKLKISTFLLEDEDSRNDIIDTTIFVSPTYTMPYTQNFETNDGYWQKGGINDTWAHGKPTGTLINKAYSGTKCWATNLTGNYANNDSAWIESPCFDFTGVDKPIMDFMLWANSEVNNDGLALYYSINEGIDWNLVPTEGSYAWNWYNNPSVQSFNHEAWDSVTNTWFKARQILPNDVANEPLVKFRFLLMTNDTITKEGFAIDDVKIYNAPTDAGITAIVTPETQCSLSKTQDITVTVKNYGIRPITIADSLFAKVILNNTITLTDTFIVSSPLAINASTNFTFSQTANMFTKKWYSMKAYTHAKGDTAYYLAGVYNDTIIDSAYVEGEPYYTLGPNIGTLDASTIQLDGKTHSIGGEDFIAYTWYYEYKDSTVTNRLFDVPSYPVGKDSITLSIIVENDSGCFANDTIHIIKSNTDVGTSLITGIDNECIDQQNYNLSVTVTNHSPITLNSGATINVGYTLGEETNEEPHIETITLLSDFPTTKDTVYNFITNPVYTKAGTHILSVFTITEVDLDYDNDTTQTTVKIFALPEVDLGADSILTLTATGTLLDAGLTNPPSTYQWQDNSTLQQFTITTDTTSWYLVTVTDSASCGSASDSVLIVSDNWVLDSLISPESMCTPSESEQISVLLINNSPNTYNMGYILTAQITVDDSVINEPIELTANLLPYDSVDYTFAHIIDMMEPKDYTIKVTLLPSHDINRLDNELDETISVWGIKKVDLGADSIITQRADTILLNAGNQFSSYEWQNGSTESTFQILTQNSETYWVSVSDFNNCPPSSDTLRIKAMDLAMEEIISPESKCDIASINTITFTIRNTGPDMIPVGEKINIRYFINSEDAKYQVYTLPYDLNPDQTRQITLNETFGFITGETYQFTMYVDWNKDYYNDNDTLKTIVYQLEYPTVDLGADIFTTQTDTIVLKTQSGYTNYSWQNSSRADSLLVTRPYTYEYWVKVGNAYGCFASDTLTVYTYDLGIESVESPNNCEPSTENTVTINIKLNSEDVLLAGEEITATYDFEGTVVTETVVLTDTFTNDAVLPYTFATPFMVSDTGNYSITCSVAMGNEVDSSNNSLNADFRIGAYPVSLGADVVTYASSVLLNAGAGFTGYLWTDSSTDQTLTVTLSGYYAVTTTDLNGCEASDSIHVLFLHPDYQIIEIMGVANNCSNDVAENISFELKNEGNDTIQAATEIPISYTINGGTAVTENYTFASKFLPGNTVTVGFDAGADLSETGVYEILVSAILAGTASTNDTTVNTWGYPSVNLGNNIETPNDEVMLDAGSGFASYLWSTAETTQTITVSTNGDYWVEVTNSNACTNRDTVNVFFVPTSLFVSDFVRPLTACEFLVNESVTIKVKNGGSKTVPAGTLVVLGYQLEGEDRVNENNTLENAMAANITLEYTFTNKLNSSTSGNKEINFYVRIDSEDIDTAEYEISVYEKPQFFGGEDTIFVSSYPYELDAEVEAESYLWNTDATTPTLTVNADGAYWLKIIDDKACEFTDTVFVDKITGISDSWSNQIEVYPNPGKSEISVNLPKNIGKVNLHITDLQGKLVFVKKDVSDNLKLDISKWEQGAYILRISNGEQFGVYRIVKQ